MSCSLVWYYAITHGDKYSKTSIGEIKMFLKEIITIKVNKANLN